MLIDLLQIAIDARHNCKEYTNKNYQPASWCDNFNKVSLEAALFTWWSYISIFLLEEIKACIIIYSSTKSSDVSVCK